MSSLDRVLAIILLTATHAHGGTLQDLKHSEQAKTQERHYAGLGCFVQDEHIKAATHAIVGEVTVEGRKVWEEDYDFDLDKKWDATTLTEYIGAGPIRRPFPVLYYFYEHNEQGQRLVALYRDLKGDGRCADMIPVEGDEIMYEQSVKQ